MDIPTPSLRKAETAPHFFYSFFGTVDRQWGLNAWMFVKVGITSNVHQRLTSYKTHCPVPFTAGVRAPLPDRASARRIEKAMLSDEDLKGFQSQGEWFAVLAGPEQHVLFIKDLLARFYIERFRDKELWATPLEWMILPDRERIHNVPSATENWLSGPEDGTGYGLERWMPPSRNWLYASGPRHRPRQSDA